MIGLNYERLDKTTTSVPPYRGSKNRFPIADRRSNTKYFLVREEDGQRVFDIVYGKTWERHDLTKEQYEALEAQGCKELMKYQRYDMKGQPIDDYDYQRYEVLPSILGTVRPDNTFEFNAKRYHQGDRTVMSSFSRGWFSTDSRRGGMVYSHGRDMLLPIYRGMRVDVSTMQPSVPYEVVIHHVDRKAAKALLAKYEHFYKVSEVMLKALTMRMVLDTARDVVDSIWKDDGGSQKYRRDEAYFTEAEKLVDDAPLDAFVLYCIALNVGRIAYQMRWNDGGENKNAHEELFMNLKRKLNKEIYKAHRDVFKEVNCESGKPYPACEWGTKIIVNGQEMEQYT